MKVAAKLKNKFVIYPRSEKREHSRPLESFEPANFRL